MDRGKEVSIKKKEEVIMARKVASEMSFERVAKHFPVEKEEKILTMDKPVIIESACPGWQIGGERFPAIPCTIEEQVKEIVDSVKAGAVCIHVHPRDPKTCVAQVDDYLLKQVLDPIFDQVDCVTLNHTWLPKEEVDYISLTDKLLKLGKGNKYCQGVVVLPIGYTSLTGAFHSRESVTEGVKWLEAHDVKPRYELYDTHTIFSVKNNLIDTNISTWKPYIMPAHLGKHSSHAIHKDPWSYLNVITTVNIIKETVPDSILGVNAGGRNWLPILVLGLLMGAQFFRVGIEDQYWLYPHKDQIIKKNSDVVKLTVDIAQLLGRRVVTDANEAREILGMKLTS